mmetsp:Transcript_5238/g.11658  ORF Transcript_5238/g.11658 Transcript_5238/m.11658 type:complete len:706 (+) Transcript_5238:148-2265(+)|eukprot:CAMPEP_0178437382 /NCGR_PEP_ID=MMETSP0689_2-20121128/34962_1 /TAXON_ID=160604 /ORGANISM="Amphidinium massartii, Strain CS-259" /LENGTH=705 /DNA_ID=CAMNT_0020059579 /DNA_START=64 /DNA_END=2181 /DNA_ORIENTATION=+
MEDIDAFGGTLVVGAMSPGGGIPSRSSSTYAVTPNCDTLAPEVEATDCMEDDDFIESLVDPSNPQDQERSVGKSRFASFGGSDGLELRWEHLTVASWQKGKPKCKNRKGIILDGINGTARSCELTCILGPSGCGKTTLLNVLAGRISGGKHGNVSITGRVLIAGRPVNPRQFRSRIAYVMQKDEMLATATPREALQFSAALRLDHEESPSTSMLIEELLGALGLLRCADTYIGNSVISGISGGQRKRTAIGVELITKPDIVCLDEPTSGLDSFAAYQVMRVLKDLARAGCTVICTLHQPSSEIFALMDRVICLCEGRSFYEGSRENMVHYLARAGFRCPVGFNPADFVIFLMQADPRERVDKLLALWQQERGKSALLEEGGATPGSNCEGRTSSQLCATPYPAAPLHGGPLRYVPHKSFSRQLSQLFRRELRSAVRDRTTLSVRFALSVMLAFLFGIVFRRVGRSMEEETEATIFDMLWTGLTPEEAAALRKQKLEWHFNAIIQVAMVSMFSASQPTILAFPLERPVFLREHSSGTYNVLPYYLSKLALEVPLVLVQSLLTLSLCYMTMELQGNFGCLLGVVVLLSICSVSVALAIGCMVRFPRETGAVGPLVFVPQMLFSGVFVPVGLIPRYLRWGQYLCFLQYAIKVLGIVEFQNVPHREMLFESQDIHAEETILYILILVLIVFFFSAVGLLMLRQRTKHLF